MPLYSRALLFKKYLNNCPVIRVKGKQFEIKHHYLEDFVQKSELRVKMPEELKDPFDPMIGDYKEEFGHELGKDIFFLLFS